MKQKPHIVQFLIFFLFCFFVTACSSQKTNDAMQPANSIEELQQQLETILSDTHTPGMSIAIVHREGPEWVAGLGKADVANNLTATADTLFRIGSTSKAFASLAILKLADQGKLSLEDPVRIWAPEVWFENRWEATSPVRIVHLLEHTTGWDDLHMREYALDARDMNLLEAFNYDHSSRISRWEPGTRMAYCNTGPAIAAYIVEKVTGERFEDYVLNNFFNPIGMNTATYFQPTSGLTGLYQNDGKTLYPYWNILYRPAGSINASANDMANYLLFYLNHGNVNGMQILPANAIDRMEIPTSTWAAKEGLKVGYGLSNYWAVFDGFVYHGHNGGVEGGLTELAYIRDQGIGYFFSINSSNYDAHQKIAKIIRSYITQGLQKPALPPIAPLPSQAAEYTGWYEFDSPRFELTNFLGRLISLSYIHFKNDTLLISSLFEKNATYLPVTGNQFRYVPVKDSAEPIPSVELLTPNTEGRFIQTDLGMNTMKHIPTWLALLEIVITGFVLLSIISILAYAPFWTLGGLSKKRRRPAERAIRLWPLVAVLSLISIVVIFMLSSDNLIFRMGNLTYWSFSLFFVTILFAASSAMSALAIWRTNKQEVRFVVRIFSTIVTVALLITTIYLAYWGIIGLRTWQ